MTDKMKIYNELVEACKEQVRDENKIARLYTMCVCVHGMELNVRDFQDKNRKPQRVRIGKRVLVFS
jgi:hypothetical protein|tara:strand:+ start:448 stop:645 length:198 start_codon:yes stop_codon:yes gene_type:complete